MRINKKQQLELTIMRLYKELEKKDVLISGNNDHINDLLDEVQVLKEGLKSLIDVAEKMRDAQKKYFRKKTKLLLDQAIKYEYILDEKVKGIKAQVNAENNNNQLELWT